VNAPVVLTPPLKPISEQPGATHINLFAEIGSEPLDEEIIDDGEAALIV
jgi:hypothetical protein